MADQNTIEDVILRRLDRIEELTLLSAKVVLTIDEAVLVTGLSKGHIYRMTSERTIPHYKQGKKLYFKRADLEDWLTENKILSKEETEQQANRYLLNHKRF